MKKIVFFALCFTFVAVHAQAQARFGLGVSVGASGYTNDVLGEEIKTHVGFIGSGNLLLLVNEWFLVGLNAEGDIHQLKSGEQDFTKISTISLIPFVELRGPAHSYLFLGVGYNLNYSKLNQSIDVSGSGTATGLNMDNTIAFKGGAGWDIFLNDNVALNIEVGWKYNKGSAYLRIPQPGGTKSLKLQDGFDASEVTGLAGLRYYF